MYLTQKILASILIILFVLPLAIVFNALEEFKAINWWEIYQSTKFTFYQALLSTLFSLFLGFLGGLGLAGQPMKRRKWLEVIFLLPNLFPVLFVILGTLNFVHLLAPFPFGLWGIVLVHSILNVGLVAIAVERVLSTKLSAVSELALVEGVSKIYFLRTSLPIIFNDLAWIGLFVFSVCFTSFAIPLIIGGMGSTTLEVLIYQRLKIDLDFSQAAWISVIQIVFIAGFSVFLIKNKNYTLDSQKKCSKLISFPLGIVFPMASVLILVLGQIFNWHQAFLQLLNNPVFKTQLLALIGNSFFVGIGVGMSTILLVSLIFFLYSTKWLDYFFLSYSQPSMVILGFMFISLGFSSLLPPLLSICMGLTVLFLPALFRLLILQKKNELHQQIETSRVFGAGPVQIFKEIIFPQVYPAIFLCARLAAFWAVGDFAFSSIVTDSDITLALIVKNLVGSYRLDLASLLTWGILLIGVTCYIFFWRIQSVFDQKFNS